MWTPKNKDKYSMQPLLVPFSCFLSASCCMADQPLVTAGWGSNPKVFTFQVKWKFLSLLSCSRVQHLSRRTYLLCSSEKTKGSAYGRDEPPKPSPWRLKCFPHYEEVTSGTDEPSLTSQTSIFAFACPPSAGSLCCRAEYCHLHDKEQLSRAPCPEAFYWCCPGFVHRLHKAFYSLITAPLILYSQWPCAGSQRGWKSGRADRVFCSFSILLDSTLFHCENKSVVINSGWGQRALQHKHRHQSVTRRFNWQEMTANHYRGWCTTRASLHSQCSWSWIIKAALMFHMMRQDQSLYKLSQTKICHRHERKVCQQTHRQESRCAYKKSLNIS